MTSPQDTRPTHGTRDEPRMGMRENLQGQALKARHQFTGISTNQCLPLSATGGSGACDAPDLPVGNFPGVSASGAF